MNLLRNVFSPSSRPRRSKVAVNFFNGDSSRGSRFLRVVEILAPNGFSSEVNSAFPFAVMLTKANADHPVRVVRLHGAVDAVLCMRNRPEVLQSVVGRLSVDVVNFIRPFTMHVKPRQTMTEVKSSVDTYGVHSSKLTARHTARNLSSPTSVPFGSSVRVVLPAKNAGFWIVIQNRTNVLGGKIVDFIARHVKSSVSWLTRVDIAADNRLVNLVGG